MLVIFLLSSQVAEQSDRVSKGVTEFFKVMISKVYSGSNLNQMISNHLIRKTAHFCAYAVLGALLTLALKKKKRAALSAFLISFTYACSDELHQAFIPGRGSMFSDVILDSTGALLGIIMISIIVKIREKKMKSIS